MKLMYVNGFREDYKPSSTYLKLKEAGFDIEPCQWKYGDDVRKKIENCIKKIKPEMIIASSTAGLFVTDYDIPVILINPVVDRKDLENHFPDKDFSNYPIKPANKSPYISVILGAKDEILDCEKTSDFFENKGISFICNEGHRLKNIEHIINEIKTYEYFEKKELDFEFDPLILDFFTEKELKIILDNAMVLGDSQVIIMKKEDKLFEINCYIGKVKIIDLDSGKLITKNELIQKLE